MSLSRGVTSREESPLPRSLSREVSSREESLARSPLRGVSREKSPLAMSLSRGVTSRDESLARSLVSRETRRMMGDRGADLFYTQRQVWQSGDRRKGLFKTNYIIMLN